SSSRCPPVLSTASIPLAGRRIWIRSKRCVTSSVAHESVSAGDDVAQSVVANPRQPDEHTRVIDVVLLQIKGTRVRVYKRVPLRNIHHHDERVRFGGPMSCETDEHFS